MRSFLHSSLVLVLTSLMMFAAASCGKQNVNNLLLVERQSAEVVGSRSISMTVDVPVAGPSVLVDSVLEFLNRELYVIYARDLGCLINGEEDHENYTYEEARTGDVEHFVQNHAKRCAAVVSDWNDDCSRFYSFSVFMIAQTDAFVTYGVRNVYEDLEPGYYPAHYECYTFDKKDGHLVREMVNKEDISVLKGLLYGPFEDSSLHFAGLCKNGMLLAWDDFDDWGSCLSVEMIDYQMMMPYLTDEAKGLVSSLEAGRFCPWEDWYLGKRIGTVTAQSDKAIVLTERYFEVVDQNNASNAGRYQGGGYYDEDGVDWKDMYCKILGVDERYAENPSHVLRAYTVKNGKISEEKVIQKNDTYVSSVVQYWDKAFNSLQNGNSFAFDSNDNTLYVPSVENTQMGYHASCDRFEVYQFDGKHFVYKGEDGGYWLNPGLREFGRLCVLGYDPYPNYEDLDNYLLRIDEMRVYDERYYDQSVAARVDTCRYRLALWKNTFDMADTPDVVIEDGWFDQAANAYRFKNWKGKFGVFLGEYDEYLEICRFDNEKKGRYYLDIVRE